MNTAVASYGSWRSPFTTDLLTSDTIGLSACRLDGEDLYWVELRPAEAGRSVLVRQPADGERTDVTAAPYDVRSRVHEYGGGAYAVLEGLVVFVNKADQRIYRVDATADDGKPQPITPAGEFRYGDLRIDGRRQHVLCVREDHSPTDSEPVNTLVRVELAGPNDDGGQVLVSGSDFVSSPRLDTTGDRLAWVTWDHPNMPWDGSTLWTGRLSESGELSERQRVGGGPTESVHDPRWAPDGRLVFLSDRTGWWNFYAAVVTETDADADADASDADADADADAQSVALAPLDLEFGTHPGSLGASGYDFTADGRLLCTWTDQGIGHLGLLELTGGSLSPLDSDATFVTSVSTSGEAAAFVASYPTAPQSVVRLTLPGLDSQVVRRSTSRDFDAGAISVAEPVEWTNPDGQPVYGFLYEPVNAEFQAPHDELPPLLVFSHGGPTGMAVPSFNVSVQYWTSRGFAVLDVNYGGSLGYGSAYRERLIGRWGIVDVADCASGALALAARGRVDPARLAIRGGSAGGYTTLCALTFTDVFKAGASYFGVGDVERLAQDTHKFESRYLDSLIGRYPEERDRYVERSPIHHLDRLACPVILFQGTDDKVVPPDQARDMAAAVRAKGLPVALLMFEGEGHGFLKAENIKRAVEAELYFYGRVFGFPLADTVEAISIDNLTEPPAPSR